MWFKPFSDFNFQGHFLMNIVIYFLKQYINSELFHLRKK